MWIWGTKFRSCCVQGSHFVNWAVFLSPPDDTYEIKFFAYNNLSTVPAWEIQNVGFAGIGIQSVIRVYFEFHSLVW